MNDFDFDALSDPDAPLPGASQRAAVDARAGQLRARARRNRFAVTATSIVAVAAIVLALVANANDAGPSITVTGSSTSTAPTRTTVTTRRLPVGKPPTTTTVTTTTVPAGPSGLAASASFVSASHGWVLEQNGTVAQTTDGGATWSAIGTIGRSGAHTHIRFADATHGFAFPADPADQAAPLETSDGGVTWKQLQTPFPGQVFDLAIARGIVYVVAIDQNANLRIWSTPAVTLDWKEDPLSIPIGAGPVPTVQLVFSGGRGWLIEVDRVVIAGAEMSTAGHWSAWTPPCSSVNGPAYLAASSATDLVASCNEGVWGPRARATTMYFSHDGGATFHRVVVPVAGQIASPDANTALVFDHNTMQRTADGGATWHIAAGLGDNVVDQADFGFTTPAQGFASLGDGTLLMTYDAGATYSPVTLP